MPAQRSAYGDVAAVGAAGNPNTRQEPRVDERVESDDQPALISSTEIPWGTSEPSSPTR